MHRFRSRRGFVLCAVTAASLFILVSGGLIGQAREQRVARGTSGEAAPEAPTTLELDPRYSIDGGPVLPGTSLNEPAQPAVPGKVPDPGAPREPLSILVHFEPQLLKGSPLRENVKLLAAARGGFTRYEYGTVLPNVINLRNVTPETIEELRGMPGVTLIEEDAYHPDLVRLDESTPLVRGLQSQLSGAGLPYDGTGIRVCVADTGIDMDHIMYSSRIDTAASYDFVNNDNNPDDDMGHGAHVAGIAVGGTGLSVDFGCEGSEPFQGMAPGATLIGSKILNSFGGGSDSDIIAGIDHCADQSPSGGRADVINLSIGTGNFSSGACTHSWAVASNNAVANGVVVIAASGNENNANSMGSPACGVDVIAVGATYKDDYPNCEDGTASFNWGNCVDNSPSRDQIVCFSNESDFLDVAAPGSVIQSASTAAGGSSITGQSGTSMASPMVAGLAALVLEADPTLTPAEVRTIIRNGAIDMGSPGFDRAYGYGRIDAINTLNQVTPCGVDADCDDGFFCNGAETCNAGSCQTGTSPCGGGVCDEGTDTCSTLAYEWTMDSDPGWTTSGQWAWGSPSGGGGQHGSPDPTGGASGSNVIGYNLAGDYANNLAETNLTSAAINMSGLTNVTLRFARWLGVEQPAYDHAYLRVSNNGSTWTTVWENTAEVADGSWTQVEYDISSVADNQSTVYLRWTMGTTDGSWQFCGWNIDDVQIYASGGGPTCSDGIQNQGETRIDCGGPCPACDCTSDAACDDGDVCNGDETCDTFGVCQNGTALTCDDGLYCNGAETCDSVAGCQSGTAVSCDDGVGCTDDSCNESTDSCDFTANNANCDNGDFCDGAETCDAVNDCQAGSDPCPGQSCDEGGDVCIDCVVDADCTDGLYCNGAETCNAGSCQAGTPVVCDDGVACTADACNEGTDSCDAVAVNANCDDGLFCNGSESCDLLAGCQAGSAVVCDDGVGCTDDACNEGTDSCDFSANNANCDDGAFCNGTETCDSLADCQSGSDPCTGLFCDEGGDVCYECNVDNDCDDGLFCNGAETCSGGACQGGGDPCPGQTCNEATDSCETTSSSARLEAGTVSVGGTHVTVNLTNSYVSPVVVAAVQYNNNTTPVVARVRNAGPTSFEIRLQNPSNGAVAAENVSYVVVEEGTWTIDGVAIEAQTYVSTVTDENNSWVGENQTYGQAYTSPVVIGQVMTENDPGWSVFWSRGTAQANPPDASNLWTGKTVCEDTDNTRAAETVGFIVIEAGHGTIGGVEFEALLGADIIEGVTNSPPYTYTFTSAFAAPPAVTVVSQAAMDGGNGGWAQLHGPTAATSTSMFLSIDEDQIQDTERGHITEQAGYLAFASAFAHEDGCVVDNDCDDGLYCNGAETCNAGSCQAGSAPTCDDGVGCTTDACNEGTDSCDFTPVDAVCDDGAFCNGAETCDAVNDCQSGNDPCPGQSCDEDADQCFVPSGAQMESVRVVGSATDTTVNLTNTYNSAVVACSVHYVDNTTPVVARVSNVTASSFDVRLQGAGGGVVPDAVTCLVVEEGVWTIDGVAVEAFTYNSTVTDENASWVGESQTYGQAYTTPVVLGQVMTDNDPSWSVFWCQGTARTNPPIASALVTGKTVCEDPDITRADETVGVIVFEAGHGTIGGVEYEAALGADSVRGVGNTPPYAYTFNTAFAVAPEHVLTTMAGVDGNNGGWSQTHGVPQSTTTQMFLSIDEDTINDTERAHTPEQVGYVVFATPVVVP